MENFTKKVVAFFRKMVQNDFCNVGVSSGSSVELHKIYKAEVAVSGDGSFRKAKSPSFKTDV